MAKTPETSVVRDTGIEELTADLSGSPYYSHDMAPVPRAGRRWGMRDMAVLWISMSACVPTYMLASGMIDEGMNWWQAVLTIFLGNLIVLVPMVLNAHAGTKYGIPFPVYCRASFGILGANVPALLAGARGLRLVRHSDLDRRRGRSTRFLSSSCPILGQPRRHRRSSASTPPQLGCFLFFWAINMWVIYKGIESIRMLLNIKAPLLIVLGLVLLAWAYYAAGGFGDDALASRRSSPRAARRRAVLAVLLRRAHRQRRLLGHAVAQHPRLQPLRLLAARPGARPGARLADDDGVCSRSSASRSRSATAVIYGADDLGSRSSCLSKFSEPGRAHRRDARAVHRHAGHEHRRQRREPGQRFRPSLAATDFVSHRRLHHRASSAS